MSHPALRYYPVYLLIFLIVATISAYAQAPMDPQKIGIFDLKAIHAVPLDAQVVKTTEADGIITEEIRYTSRPGVRVLACMSYPKGAKKLACNINIRNYGVESRAEDAKVGFVGVSVCAPSGNTDPNKRETVGGPPFKDQFMDDPETSWVYHHVVALTRMIDYLETRPEVDTSRMLVMGYSWSGWICSLFHAIDNRPAVYVSWHSAGYFADQNGISGDKPCMISRKHYEMYAPSAYAKYGTKPIFIASALTDYFSTLDGLIEFYGNLKCPKALSIAPNRYHASTGRNEYRGSSSWGWHWQGNGPKPPTVDPGQLSVKNGRLIYTFNVASTVPLTNVEVMYTYGKPGHWVGRTWHRKTATKGGANSYSCEIPLYDPITPLYAVAQVETKDMGASANLPQYIDPAQLGITASTAAYPNMLFNFEDKDDLYITTATAPDSVAFINEAPEGKVAAKIKPFDDGTVHFLYIEPSFWKNARELRFYLKGDGKKGPVDLYLVYDTAYYLDFERGNYTKITLVPESAIFEASWKEYVVPLKDVKNADQIDSLFFDVGTREAKSDLLIDAIRWQ